MPLPKNSPQKQDPGIKWWYTRGYVSIITIPIALFLLYGTVLVFIHGGIQTIAYWRILHAVFGFFGIILFFFVWPFSLFIPGMLWWSTLKEIPKEIQNRARSRVAACGYFIAGLVIFISIASGLQWFHGSAIAWIADRNPDAAYEVGVRGTKLPSFFLDDNE